MSGNVDQIAKVVREIVEFSGPVSGSTLSASLRARVPGWNPADFGLRSLKEFVERHVPGVVIAGRSGLDVMYAQEGTPPTPMIPRKAAGDADLWRVWVSPNSPMVLVVDRSGPSVRAVPRNESIPETHVRLQPPEGNYHREIAREFLRNLPGDEREALESSTESEGEDWWRVWLQRIRASEHFQQWNQFRRQRFADRLIAVLLEAGLNEKHTDQVLELVRASHTTQARLARATPTQSSAQLDDAALRRVVSDAIQAMSTAELRDLRLPLGIVLDLLATHRAR